VTPGSRTFDEQQDETRTELIGIWDDFADAELIVHREYQNDLVAWIAETALDKAGFLAGCVVLGGPATLVIWAASTVGDLTDVFIPGELGLAGLVVAEGHYLLFGPTYFIPVFIAGGLVDAALFKRRLLTDPGMEQALEEAKKVFLDTIPYERIVVTNLGAFDSRPFCIPGIDQRIIMGMGDGFDDLVGSDQKKRLFIHELTHAWQYVHQQIFDSICRIA
jgi:hypothetical protein